MYPAAANPSPNVHFLQLQQVPAGQPFGLPMAVLGVQETPLQQLLKWKMAHKEEEMAL